MTNILKEICIWIKDAIKAAVVFQRAINGLKTRQWFSYKDLRKGELFKLNPWIDYVTTHSELTYTDAIGLYDELTSLPFDLTQRRVTRITQLIMDTANLGVEGRVIDVGLLAASIEAAEAKKRGKK